LALTLASLLALAGVVLAASGREREPAPAGSAFAGAVMPKGVRAPDFSLHDQDGRRVSMRGLRGRPVVVTFLYTTCDNNCPTQAHQVRGALDDLGRDLPALAVAVDPPHDTARRARAFLSKTRSLGRLDFVLGSREQLKRLWKGFAVRPQSVTQEHQSRVTLVDRRGFQRVGFPGPEATPERLAHDLRLLERER